MRKKAVREYQNHEVVGACCISFNIFFSSVSFLRTRSNLMIIRVVTGIEIIFGQVVVFSPNWCYRKFYQEAQ